MSNEFNRRQFIGVGAVAAAGLMIGCNSKGGKTRTMESVKFLDHAPDGKELKAGLIGCGGRGTGAAINFLDAGPNLKIHSLGDVFQDRIDGCNLDSSTILYPFSIKTCNPTNLSIIFSCFKSS